MSEAEAKRFIEAVDADPKLKEKLESMSNSPELVYKEVVTRGFDCTPEEIKIQLLETLRPTLSEEELSEIAAGLSQGGKIAVGVVGSAAVLAVGAAAAAAM
ncbi:MAG: Nif11 domain [Actinomycetota bacterium]|jgi:predicted ribosomally synthesized peptide with nif11-like leader